MTKDTSGPAFPCKLANERVYTIVGFAGEEVPSEATATYAGMSIRQYAAIKAMQGLLAKNGCNESWIAYESVRAADALLAELEKVE